MKTRIRALWLILAVYGMCLWWLNRSIAQSPSAQPSSTLFTLQLSTLNHELKKGNEKIVVVKLTNIWNKPIPYPVGGPGGPNGELHFQITDEHGNSVKETPFGMKAHGTDPHSAPWSGSIGVAFIAPGETKTRIVDLEKEYALAAPGKYHVTASRYDALALREFFSNKVEITVTSK